MPFFHDIKAQEGWGGIWRITESVDELCGMLPHGEDYRHQAARFASERRQLEFLSVRLLIYVMLGRETPVKYQPSGRPYLEGTGLQVSISHTFGYAAVLFSKSCEAGIDIEAFSHRIVRLKSRLIGPQEKADTVYEMLLHWSAKESVFKILDEEGIDFREHLVVEDLRCTASDKKPQSEGDFSLSYHLRDGKHGCFPVHFETARDFVLTYVFRKL